MTPTSANQEQSQTEHLSLVRALSQEITAAIAAIEKNDLQRFQATIANQERICHELVVRKWSPAAANGTGQLHQAYVELKQLNRVYTGVIKRSKRCADLLLALYGSCGTGYGKNAPGLADRQSLICEV
jgi:hypothetical protein